MPVPIVLPITDFTRREIKQASAVALTNAAGVPIAILRAPEASAESPLGGGGRSAPQAALLASGLRRPPHGPAFFLTRPPLPRHPPRPFLDAGL